MINSLRPHGLYGLPGSSVHGIFQARILEWVAISFSRRSSWPRDWTWVSRIIGRCFTIWATGEVTLVQSLVLLAAFLWSCSVYLTLPRLIVLNLIEIIAKLNEMVHHESLGMYIAHSKHSVSQEAGQVVWYSHLFQNFPVYCDPHTQRLWHSQSSRNRCFSGTFLLFPWSSRCWQFDLWFLCLF